MRLVILVSSLIASSALAQPLQFGVKAGVPITEYYDTGAYGALHGDAHYTATARRYTLAGVIEWRINRSLGLELDTQFHRMGYVAYVNTFNNGNYTNSVVDVIGDSWDFPLALKYHLPLAPRLFVLGGGVLRYVGPVRGHGHETDGSLITQTSTTTSIDTTYPSELRKRFYPGVTFGAGVDCPAGRVMIVPEFRYTRWTANISGEGGLLRFSPNQIEVLVGFVFGRK
jgi:hypothetical protein